MMMLYLDYQSSMRPFPWVGAALLGLALLAFTIGGVYYYSVLAKISYWEAKYGQVEKVAARHATTERELKEMGEEIKHANEVLNQITLPWDKLFLALEWSSGKDVALLTMDPDAERHEVKISGEAKNMGAVLRYIEHLSAQDIFAHVYLQSHQVQERDPEKPVRFALVAAWKVAP